MSNRPSDAEIQDFLNAANAAADSASKLLLSYFGNLRHVSEKDQAGLVSEADRESEALIFGLLHSRFPEHRFLGEETGLQDSSTTGKSSNAIWIIDPLDGTTNYVHQFPVFGSSIALEVDGEVVVGVVDAPKLGMRWSAARGQGAFFNGEKINVSQRNQFRDGLYATGFSSIDDNLESQFALLEDCIKDARGIRRAGAASLDQCFVAQGVFDVFWEKNLSSWDMAAGSIIVKEAGGLVTNFEGKPFTTKERNIVAGNPALHAEILKRMKRTRK